ncbi:type II toxin-antitoxin system VapC family toxin [Maricaulis sp.]|uniref:type II toxin-antitoxin system VapC family toxin n=1 Tax=Maricaulis sp. TaxID=1486257 RepID=UPI00262D97D2|nr:type II toxin-antitoxin system VapC family toxin [Maricaulis sp.]
MSACILDASVAVKWFIDDVLTPQALRAGHVFNCSAPTLIVSEVANGLWKYARRGDVSVADCRAALTNLPTLTVLHSSVGLVGDAIDLAVELDHPVYDCQYLALARQQSVPVLSADKRLLSLARDRLGLETIDLADIPPEIPAP